MYVRQEGDLHRQLVFRLHNNLKLTGAFCKESIWQVLMTATACCWCIFPVTPDAC